MKTPLQWDLWCDSFLAKHGRQHYWSELIRAVQADALGQPEPPPFTEEQIDALSDEMRKPEVTL